MPKRFLEGFTISEDIIDQVSREGGNGSSPESNSVEPPGSAESPPVGTAAEHETEADVASHPDAPRFWCDGGIYRYERDLRRYEVRGLERSTSISLRVQLRLLWEGRRQFDGLDLVSARSRKSFAAEVERVWGIPAETIESDLRDLVDCIERDREASPRPEEKPSEIVLSREDREAGEALLASPDLVEEISSDIERLGYVGEPMNSLLVYLCATSRKLDSPLVVAVTSLSDQALNYFDDLTHKFLILGEAVHSEQVEHQLREMLSAKELRRLVTVKDPETGRMTSRMVSKPVVVASVMSGTSYKMNPENASRCFLISTDESDEQTKRIHEAQRRKHTLEAMRRNEVEIPRIIRRHRAAQMLLEPLRVVNPLAPYLDFPSHQMRLRRDHERFLDLMASVAFLRQKQKTRHTEGAFTYVEVDLTDYRIARELMVRGVLERTLGELPGAAERLLEAIRGYVAKRVETSHEQAIEVSFTQRSIREATGYSHSWVKQNLRVLLEYEYVDVVRGGSARSRGYYRLSGGRSGKRNRTSSIPTPEAIEALIR
jgi:DNA primase